MLTSPMIVDHQGKSLKAAKPIANEALAKRRKQLFQLRVMDAAEACLNDAIAEENPEARYGLIQCVLALGDAVKASDDIFH